MKSKNYVKEPIYSKPIDKDELINMLLLSNKEQFRNVLNTRKNIKDEIINSENSKFNMENIAKHTIKILEGDKIVPPKRQFLVVKNITLDNINEQEMIEAKNLYNLQNNFKKIKEEAEDMLLSNIEKSKKHQERMFNEFYENTKLSLNKIEETQKNSEDLINFMKNKLEEEFNKDMIQYGLEKMQLHEKYLDNLKNSVSNLTMRNNNLFNQDFGMNMDRFKLLEDSNKRVFSETNKILSKYNLEIPEEENKEDNNVLNEKDSNKDKLKEKIIDDNEVDSLYKKFENNKTFHTDINKNKTLNKMRSNSKFTFSSPPDVLFKKPKKIIRSTINFQKIKNKI